MEYDTYVEKMYRWKQNKQSKLIGMPLPKRQGKERSVPNRTLIYPGDEYEVSYWKKYASKAFKDFS